MKRKMLLFTLALPAVLLQSAQAQTNSRLTSESHLYSMGLDYLHSDSMEYAYSHGRGSAAGINPATIEDIIPSLANYNGMFSMYNNATNIDFGGTSGDSAYAATYYYQTFDANNNVLTNTMQNAITGTPIQNIRYQYNASNMITRVEYQHWDVSSGTGVWVSDLEHIYSYNTAGKLYIEETHTYNALTSSWDPETRITYHYDAAMNLTDATAERWVAGSPVFEYQYVRTYTTTNQLKTTTYNRWNVSNWNPSSLSYRFTHDYNAAGDLITLQYERYDAMNAVWVNNALDIYSNYTASHLPVTRTHQVWDPTGTGSWVNNMEYTYTYNSFNQLIMSNGISWNFSSNSYQRQDFDPMDSYFYQAYTPTAVVSVANGTNVKVFPVPATNSVNVELTWKDAQAADITMVNAVGAVVKHISVPAAAKLVSAIPVGDLAPGVYFININGDKEQIVKQVVVAH